MSFLVLESVLVVVVVMVVVVVVMMVGCVCVCVKHNRIRSRYFGTYLGLIRKL